MREQGYYVPMAALRGRRARVTLPCAMSSMRPLSSLTTSLEHLGGVRRISSAL